MKAAIGSRFLEDYSINSATGISTNFSCLDSTPLDDIEEALSLMSKTSKSEHIKKAIRAYRQLKSPPEFRRAGHKQAVRAAEAHACPIHIEKYSLEIKLHPCTS